MEKKRIGFYDTAKGILIFLVIVGHVTEQTDNVVGSFIYAFHMPAFFILSGMVLHHSSLLKKSPKATALTLVQTLLVPWLFSEFLGVIESVLRKMINHDIGLSISEFVMGVLTRVPQIFIFRQFSGSVWFLACLFFAEVIFAILHRLNFKGFLQIGISLIFATICFSFRDFYPAFFLCRVFVALFWVLLGFHCKEIFEQSNCKLACLSLFITILCAVYNGKVDMFFLRFNNPILYLIGSFTGTCFVIFISKQIAAKPITYFGQNTIPILMTQRRYLTYATAFLKPDLTNYKIQMALIIAITVVEFPTVCVMNKLVPHLIGKKKFIKT